VYSNLDVHQNDSTLRVKFSIKNSGKFDGDEVAQVYIKLPKRNISLPVKELKGFNRLSFNFGEQRIVSIDIDKSRLRYWDETSASFVHPIGEYEVMVGASSDDIRLNKKIMIK
jgi:beta-glucosidase